MLKHSSSDLKISTTMRHTNSDETLSSGRQKTKLLSSNRRSFRRKTKPAVIVQTDDFGAFTSNSASSTPQNVRKKTMPDNTSNSLSSTSVLSNGQSDSDSVSQSPPPASRVHRTSESEEGSAADNGKEKDVVEGGNAVPAQDGKLVRVVCVE